MSESEFPGLVDRFDVQRGSGDVAATARALDPASYAGTWLDLSVGKIYNAYTHDAARHEPALRAAARRPDAVEVVQMPFTLGYLESSAQTIMEGRDRAASRGIEIISTSVREPLNAVVVGLPSATAGTRDEIAELFSVDRAALRLEIVPRPANDSAPFGGHAMTNGCSAGAFGFTRTSTGAINQRFLVSAAHCGDSAQHRTGGTAGGGGHAPTYNVTLQQEAGNVDAQRMLASPAEPTRVVEGWGSPDFTLDGSASLFGTYDVVGAWVCSAGYATGGVNNCGQIDSRAHSCTVAGIAFNNLGRATYTRTGGDSGGTVYGFIFGSSTVPLVGFHKGTCGGAVYSKQTYVLSAMGLAGWDANL